MDRKMKSDIIETRHSKSDSPEKIRCFILVACAFMSHLLSTGMSFSLGVYHLEFLKEFNKGNGVTSFIGSLNFGALCAAGPLSSFLVPHIGCASVVILGGVISSLGIFICCFSRNIYLVMVVFGVITGVGYGLISSACITQTTCSITRWRAICNGISTAGAGLGSVVNPLVAEFLISRYNWRGALLITSALTLNVCVLGLIIRSLNRMDGTNKSIHDVEYAKVKQIPDVTGKEKYTKSQLDVTVKHRCPAIFQNPMLWCIHINIILFCFGQSIVFTHVAAFAVSHGFSQLTSSSFISVLGITGVIGRLLLGVLCNFSCINAHILYVGLNSVAAICILGYTVWKVYFSMATMLAIAGIAFATYGPVLCEISIYVFGIDGFARGYGFLLLSMAIGTFLGAPVAGQMYDLTEIYSRSFYLASASLFTASLVYFVGYVIHKRPIQD